MCLVSTTEPVTAADHVPESIQQSVSAEDRGTFERVIAAQIEAIRAGNAAGAYSFAAPGIQAKFGSPAPS
jgi:hypothetical protein